MRARCARWAILAIATAMIAVPALADPGAEKEARALFKEGNALIDRGSYVDALDRFNRAYARWPNPKILLNIATSLRQLGRWAEAADAYSRYLKDSGADPKRQAEVESVIRELDAKVGRLRIEVSEPGARILLDGRPLEGDLASVRVDPGPHTVIVEKPGFTPAAATVTLAAGEQRSVTLTLLTAAPAASASAAPAPSRSAPAPVVVPTPLSITPGTVQSTTPDNSSTPRPTRGSSRATSAYVFGGAGILLLGVGAYFGLDASSKWHDARDKHCAGGTCDDEGLSLIDSARSAAWVANFAIGLGVVGVGAGSYLLLTQDGGKKEGPRQGIRVLPAVGKTGGGISVGGAW